MDKLRAPIRDADKMDAFLFSEEHRKISHVFRETTHRHRRWGISLNLEDQISWLGHCGVSMGPEHGFYSARESLYKSRKFERKLSSSQLLALGTHLPAL